MINIICGDAAEKLKELPDGSIDLVVTSPPYDNLRTYDGHNDWHFEAIALQLYRVLKSGGVLCWNVNDSVVDGSETLTSCKQKIFFREQCGFRIHDTMIYEKVNGSKPDPTRYNPCMEYIFVLSKGKPKTINLIRDKRNSTSGKPCFGLHTMREKDGTMSVRKDRKIAAEFGVRSNVWCGLTRGQEDAGMSLPQPAMMPKWLARDLILSFSNHGDLVCDPMAGSGTTGVQAIETGRRALLIEKNPEYAAIAQRFCGQATPGMNLGTCETPPSQCPPDGNHPSISDQPESK
jgi:site-specific DNA-methyltransferase (adenine-specific)